jgi:large subunit ribosomal protein L24
MVSMKKTKQPRKQRKRSYNAPLHRRQKSMKAHLREELKKEYGKRNAVLRTGDTVKIMRGEHAGRGGKVTRIDLKNYRIYVEGIFQEKANGEESPIPIKASNVMITELDLSDERRGVVRKKRKEK